MEGPITDSAREAMLQAALSRVEARALRESLQATTDPRFPISKPIANALASLRKHRDPLSVLGRAQYRAALPYAAAVMAEPCLSAVIEVLGDNADDPTREQLMEALEAVGPDFDDVTLTLMLASVADGEMTASDLCFEVLDSDERFGLTDWARFERVVPEATRPRTPTAASAEQREARKARKQREAEEKRRQAEAKAKAADQVRRARKSERTAGPGRHLEQEEPERATSPVAPSLGRRRAVLTPLEEEEFDRDDPWVGGVVLAWVPFDALDPDHPELEGKVRPCVVVAGSATHVLVRPGYSEGGMKSRDWKSVPVRYWRRSGFDQPTWIDVVSVRVPRPEVGPTGWLAPDDWNSLW
ncbi:MAG: hypothetical protein ABSF84_01740 [Acidimicrobiales bacterium]|jgi:hypothetical protein